ncbi:MAG: hypothetical protein U0640_10630 [Phycisphaerales bacterium]
MDPALIRQLALGAFPPLVLGFIIFAAMWWSRRNDLAQAAELSTGRASVSCDMGSCSALARSPYSKLRELLVLLGLAGSFLVLYPLIYGQIQAFPGRSADGALFYSTIIALFVCMLCIFVRCPFRRSVIIALAAAGIAFLTFRRNIMGLSGAATWPIGRSAFILALVPTLSVSLSLALSILANRGRLGGIISIVACVGAIAQTLVVTLANLKHAQGAGILASFLLPAALIVFLRPAMRLPASAMCFCSLVLAILLTQAVQFGDADHQRTNWFIIGIVALAPWAAVAVLANMKRGGFSREVLAIIACSIVGGACVGYGAYQTLKSQDNKSSGEDYDPYGG